MSSIRLRRDFSLLAESTRSRVFVEFRAGETVLSSPNEEAESKMTFQIVSSLWMIFEV